jgi:hypothetical protein
MRRRIERSACRCRPSPRSIRPAGGGQLLDAGVRLRRAPEDEALRLAGFEHVGISEALATRTSPRISPSSAGGNAPTRPSPTHPRRVRMICRPAARRGSASGSWCPSAGMRGGLAAFRAFMLKGLCIAKVTPRAVLLDQRHMEPATFGPGLMKVSNFGSSFGPTVSFSSVPSMISLSLPPPSRACGGG